MLTCSQSSQRHVGLSQRPDHQEDAHVGRRVVNGDGRAGHEDPWNCEYMLPAHQQRKMREPTSLRTPRDINVVVPSAIVADIFHGLGQSREKLCVKGAGELGHNQP